MANEWTWGAVTRHPKGNWEVEAQVGDVGDYGFSVSLNPDDESVSVVGWCPPGTGVGGLASLAAEAMARINEARYGVVTTVGSIPAIQVGQWVVAPGSGQVFGGGNGD